MALDYKLIGERLKKTRLEKKYTQEKLSEILDVSIAYLSRIETGSANISLKRLSELCDIFGVTEGYILNGSSNTSNFYLNDEFCSILKNCSPEEKELIYKIATVVCENKK